MTNSPSPLASSSHCLSPVESDVNSAQLDELGRRPLHTAADATHRV
ncbi:MULTISPECIES: hypothetical protein [unclassified Streptomyces]|nr:hypothetical protein [Streptomyces sp. NBC_00589]WTI33555.1 hypothetical protein OIC96_00210 [Streptomyces sp. NBC_00775]WUB32773.1 hypothetical protein OHA51_49525 [Streptomyces sp. NBC_00589]